MSLLMNNTVSKNLFIRTEHPVNKCSYKIKSSWLRVLIF